MIIASWEYYHKAERSDYLPVWTSGWNPHCAHERWQAAIRLGVDGTACLLTPKLWQVDVRNPSPKWAEPY